MGLGKVFGKSKSDKELGFVEDQIRTLYVYNQNWTARSIQILDEDNSTVLYDVDSRYRRPNMTFRRPGSEDETVGTISFNPWTRAITADIQNDQISVKSKNWKCCDLPYTSRAFDGRTLTWQRQTPWVVLDHYLTDEYNMPVARFRPRCGFKKAGAIEIVDRDMPQAAVDEIVLTGMAVMANTRYYACSAASSAAASSSSAAAVAVAA